MSLVDTNGNNIILIKKYIDRYYVIYRIYAERIEEKGFPLAHDFSIKGKDSDMGFSVWNVEKELETIFSVDNTTIKKALKSLVIDKINQISGNKFK